MYWSEVFSHSKVAPFDLSKGSPSGESENYGKPATGKALHLQVVLFYGGSNGAVMSTIRCTRSPKRKRGKKKKKPGRQSYRSLPHTVLPPLPQNTAVGKPDPGSFATGRPAASTSAGMSASQPWRSALTLYSNVAITMV